MIELLDIGHENYYLRQAKDIPVGSRIFVDNGSWTGRVLQAECGCKIMFVEGIQMYIPIHEQMLDWCFDEKIEYEGIPFEDWDGEHYEQLILRFN